jgi:hypothetical protein
VEGAAVHLFSKQARNALMFQSVADKLQTRHAQLPHTTTSVLWPGLRLRGGTHVHRTNTNSSDGMHALGSLVPCRWRYVKTIVDGFEGFKVLGQHIRRPDRAPSLHAMLERDGGEALSGREKIDSWSRWHKGACLPIWCGTRFS